MLLRRHELERFTTSLKKEDGLLLLYDPVFKTEAIAKQRLEHEPLIIGHRRIDPRRIVLSSGRIIRRNGLDVESEFHPTEELAGVLGHDHRAIAFARQVSGERVARVWVAFSRRAVGAPLEVALNGQLGLVLASADGDRAALSFVVSGGRITHIDAVRNPEKLRRVQ